ncbi:hypothetical protein Kpho02_59800 [Kitasatospora phosalacinea]|uniref:Uncharacterized protein n=1 Tax=Kitasatospora phosalacinea TaxID=2065 RepID=A0A9W6V3I0_9ACTN|nr:hypothetical protein Kpho02_59800 [Kitasatospora phosalacinea]
MTRDGWLGYLGALHEKEAAGGRGKPPRGGFEDHPPGPGPEVEPETVAPGNPDMAPRSAARSEDDIPDAEIVVTELPSKVSAAAEPAPQPPTEQPGTVRSGSTASFEGAAGSGGQMPRRSWGAAGAGMAGEHQTAVTLTEFLIAMANIKVHSSQDAEKVQNAVDNLTVWAHRWRRMCGELSGSHNLERKLVRLLDALASLSDSTAENAGRLAQAVHAASQKATEAAQQVAQVYEEDRAAMREGGLEQASAAVHHQ